MGLLTYGLTRLTCRDASASKNDLYCFSERVKVHLHASNLQYQLVLVQSLIWRNLRPGALARLVQSQIEFRSTCLLQSSILMQPLISRQIFDLTISVTLKVLLFLLQEKMGRQSEVQYHVLSKNQLAQSAINQ